MQLTGLDLVMWVAAFVGHLLLLCILWRTGRAKSFPVFTSLISLSVLRTATLFCLLHYGGKLGYFYGYWSFAIVDTLLQILVIGEAAVHVFRPVKTWVPGSRASLIAILLVGSLISCLLTWLASPPTLYFRQFIVIKGELFGSILTSELFIGLLVLSITMGVPLRTDAAVIVEMLGLNSLKDIVIHALQAHYGVAPDSSTFTQLSRVGILGYCITLGFWIFAFGKKAVPERELPDKLRGQLLALNNRMAAELRNLQSLGR